MRPVCGRRSSLQVPGTRVPVVALFAGPARLEEPIVLRCSRYVGKLPTLRVVLSWPTLYSMHRAPQRQRLARDLARAVRALFLVIPANALECPNEDSPRDVTEAKLCRSADARYHAQRSKIWTPGILRHRSQKASATAHDAGVDKDGDAKRDVVFPVG